jgi:hypothetical protein
MHKLKLPLGPWSTEPNEKHWVDPATGLHCLIKRHPDSLHLCGYVGVPSSHPAFGHDYDKLALSVHGGITHGDHIESAPMPDLWWIGFDCAHAFDYSPGSTFQMFKPENYRDMNYVTRECTQLAAQLVDYVPPMKLRDALMFVLARAENNPNALPLEEEIKVNEALAIVREHIESLED